MIRKEVRQKVALYIQEARRDYKPDAEVREFEVQDINCVLYLSMSQKMKGLVKIIGHRKI